MTSSIHYQKAHYITSSTTLAQLPPDIGSEIAFIGRSNAGKSSALNAITNVKGLARTSRSPGRTQMINFFNIDDIHRLVDLPGYGFAKVPTAVKVKWQHMTSDYLEKRESLRGLVVVMDSRHPLKSTDLQMITWCVDFKIPIHILLTKADKLTVNDQKKAFFFVESEIKKWGDAITLQLFSSPDKRGVDEARAVLDTWFMG